MKSTVKFFGTIALVAMVGFSVAACASLQTPRTYYDLGDVSGEFAVILVNGLAQNGTSEFERSNMVTINGEGSADLWQAPPIESSFSSMSEGWSLVRVAPGTHTFETYFVFEGARIPVSLTYEIQAGMGYNFWFYADSAIEGDGETPNVINVLFEIFSQELEDGVYKGKISKGVAQTKVTHRMSDLRMQRVAGTWLPEIYAAGSDVTLILNADGTGTQGGRDITWNITDNNRFNRNGEVTDYSLSANGGTLALILSQVTADIYIRQQ